VQVEGGPETVARSWVYRLSYPAQEHKLGVGENPVDPATRSRAGEILFLDRDERLLELKRGPSLDDVELPEALLPGKPYWTEWQEAALVRAGRSLIAGDRHYPAVESVLRRRTSRRWWHSCCRWTGASS
jgi:uncharacterized protein